MSHAVNPHHISCPVELKNKLKKLIGNDYVEDNEIVCVKYSMDTTENLSFPPDIVVRPENAQEISQIMKWANEYKVPVTVRGRGTGLSGAALPILGGICLLMDRFDRILNIDRENLQAEVEPYILNYSLQEAAIKEGLFYPPDPASYRICSLGGNISHNSGGPKAVKYGVTRNYVLELDLVLPDGRIITAGSRALKNSTGYSIRDLIIGSEGTLGIVTKAVLKLIPAPKYNRLMYATFKSVKSAVESVHAILLAGLVPSGLELMERTALTYAKLYCKSEYPPLGKTTHAHLLIELDGNSEIDLDSDRDKIGKILKKSSGIQEIIISENEQQTRDLWTLRRSVYSGIKAQGVLKEMDFCVPIADLPKVIDYMNKTGKEHGFKSASYGHAGDGNLHVGIVAEDDSISDAQNRKIQSGIRKIFEFVCKNCDGVISGEHGIGLVQKPYIDLRCSPEEIKLMSDLKRLFDPNNILNPGKIFPLH